MLLVQERMETEDFRGADVSKAPLREAARARDLAGGDPDSVGVSQLAIRQLRSQACGSGMPVVSGLSVAAEVPFSAC